MSVMPVRSVCANVFQSPLRILAGRRARAHIAQHGLQVSDIRAVPAAAGGPKGLLLKALDQYLFGEWFKSAVPSASAPPIHVVGASIGSWRMACAASSAPVAALDELHHLYLHEQRYERKASRSEIDSVCKAILTPLVQTYGASLFEPSRYALHLLTVRGHGSLAHLDRGHRRGFAKATLGNALGRRFLGNNLERVAFHHGAPMHFLPASEQTYRSFDGLPTRNLPLTASNLQPVLSASGAIPLLISPQAMIDGAPIGPYWDGGISDYHFHWPWPCLGGITLYPHFAPYIVPGWLDKFLKHRRARGEWLDNTVLLCPSDDFVRSLPNGKIPDRQDFKRFGFDWQARERAWNQSIGQAGALAEAFAQFVRRPDMSRVEALN